MGRELQTRWEMFNYHDMVLEMMQVFGNEDPALCICGGGGWFVTDCDTVEKCWHHFRGQRHPESTQCHRCGKEECFDAPACEPRPAPPPVPAPPPSNPEDDDIPF